MSEPKKEQNDVIGEGKFYEAYGEICFENRWLRGQIAALNETLAVTRKALEDTKKELAACKDKK